MISKSEAGRMGAAAARQTIEMARQRRVSEYNKNPKLCRNCANPIEYTKQENIFCSQSCAAKLNNKIFPKKSSISHGTFIDKVTKEVRQRPNCLECGTQVPKGYTTFCSQRCRNEHKRKDFEKQVLENTVSRGQMATLRKYVISLYGNRCLDPECAWDHDKRPVTVELEHKDGNSENNRIENLTLLCPNCHSLTPTYKSKNVGNGRAFRRQRYAEGKSY